MQDRRWDRIREVFDHISQLAPEARSEALKKLCPNDPELQSEVLSLLEHDDLAAPKFLAPLVHSAAPADADTPDPLIGARLGKCTIQRVIASGGMGVVYEAEQESPKRIVAIKVMKSLACSASALRRFELEVQALARLSHPNIAQIFDAEVARTSGSQDRVPYFVLEFIPDACLITDYAKHHKLDRQRRLELFLQVCDAIHYGHQRGIIHRDLKPANILVGVPPPPLPKGDTGGSSNSVRTTPSSLHLGKGEGSPSGPSPIVKVIDFGVAKATDADMAVTTFQTDTGQLLGTIQYMSPEQCDADPLSLDVRTDIYSLGMVLYELIVGQLAYDVSGVALPSAIRKVCEAQPLSPSGLNRRLRGDLETILLKALEKDRAKRYQSVADFARDIRHYLDREPIEARRRSARAAIKAWTRHHPLVTTSISASFIGILMLVGFLIVALQANKTAKHEAEMQLSAVKNEKRVLQEEIEQVHLRPFDAHTTDGGRNVEVLSRSQRILHSWRRSKAESYMLADLVEEDGKQLLIIGESAIMNPGNSGKLIAFDAGAGAFEQPIWSNDVLPRDMPCLKEDRDCNPGDYSPCPIQDRLMVEDVFPETPGRELIVCYLHSYSRRLIRILSLRDGTVLWQVWHDGAVWDMHWLSAAKILVIAGSNDEATWEQRGGEAVTGNRFYPWVVWAIRPEFGWRENRYICTSPLADCVTPAWYKAVLPQASTDTIETIKLGIPEPSQDPGSYFRLILGYPVGKIRPEAGWYIDASGSIIQMPPHTNDAYLEIKPTPKFEDFYLGALPAITHDSK